MTASEALIFAEKFMRCNFEECLKSDIDCDVCENDYEKIGTLNDFCEKAIEALEKQIPQKISIEGYCGFVDYICPVCGNDIDLNKKHNYCSNCGQMLEK